MSTGVWVWTSSRGLDRQCRGHVEECAGVHQREGRGEWAGKCCSPDVGKQAWFGQAVQGPYGRMCGAAVG
jgi:hypothetical protein